jgi:hypothetical protein
MLGPWHQNRQKLTDEEFASMLLIGNTPVYASPPAIPAAHSARSIALGYMMDLQGRLRMTTPGRYRMYARQLAGSAALLHDSYVPFPRMAMIFWMSSPA